MRDWIIELLECPLTGEPLSPAPDDLVAELNRAIAEGTLLFRNQSHVTLPLDGGLVNGSRTLFYGIFQDVPNLIPDEAVELPPRTAAEPMSNRTQHEESQ